jgi:hypothetical protein
MMAHQFTIIATGLDAGVDDFEDRFIVAGCDDATIAFQRGVIVAEFDRAARTYIGALVSAVGDVSRAGATVLHVEPNDLPNLSDIAARTGLTRAAISNFAKGERGKGFPFPVARVTTDTPLWDLGRGRGLDAQEQARRYPDRGPGAGRQDRQHNDRGRQGGAWAEGEGDQNGAEAKGHGRHHVIGFARTNARLRSKASRPCSQRD